MHLLHPVAQRVHHQLQHVGVRDVEGVAATGVVGVPATPVGEPVVGGVVDAAPRQRRPELVALGGVVVDDIEHDLEPGLVVALDHVLELVHLLTARTAGRVGRMRGEVRQGVVAPVVGQPVADQVLLVREVVHREQLDGGDAEAQKMVEHRVVRHAGEGAAQVRRHVGVARGHALDVGLVDDRVAPGDARACDAEPVEVVGHDHRTGDVGGRVAVVAHEVVVALADVPEGLRPQVDHAVDGPGVGIHEQLVGVPPPPARGVPRTVHPEAVARARRDSGDVGVEDVERRLAQVDPMLGAVVVEQAQVDRLGALGPDRHVDAVAVGHDAEGVPVARPQVRAVGAHRSLPPAPCARNRASP